MTIKTVLITLISTAVLTITAFATFGQENKKAAAESVKNVAATEKHLPDGFTGK